METPNNVLVAKSRDNQLTEPIHPIPSQVQQHMKYGLLTWSCLPVNALKIVGHKHTVAEVLVALFNLFKNQYTNRKNFTNGLIPNPHGLSSYLNIIIRAAVNSSG